ncbi:hypothetical protein GP486_005586 [Trichoglossum hirsutum]|uniref:Uncharacterized protein n=1 Tax=Trichoglossum hirsutum TaxID=265104 RepID=A0A9P8RLZ0_9PEZI|nr:hypothetical protein GP486_005586 [Trichoglossum hirsutum]
MLNPSASSAISSLNAIPQPTIRTSSIVQSGTTQFVAVLAGGSIPTPITFPTPTTTITSNSPDLSTSVASVSNQITALFPAISSWASNPAPAKATPIINDITAVVGGIAVLLGNLPHGGGGGLGLFGSLIGGLGSIANGLESIVGNLPSGVVGPVLSALEGVKFDTDNLKNDEDKDSQTTTGTKNTQSTTSTSSGTKSSQSSSSSSSSSCTSTTTGYDTYVTCTVISSSKSVSTSCETSTVTTSGCQVTTTASTTTVSDCPLKSSISADYLSARAAAGTVVSGTTYPLAFWPTDVPVTSATSSTSGSSTSRSSASGSSSGNSTSTTSTSRSSSSSSASSLKSTSTTPPPPPTTTTTPPPPPSTTTSAAPTGPTGFHVVALKCNGNCQDALEIVPSAQDSCDTIAQNQPTWWGAAFPHPAEQKTQTNANQIPPFSLLQDSSNFDVLYVFSSQSTFSSKLCGLPKLNFTFTKTSATQNGAAQWSKKYFLSIQKDRT